MKGLSLHRYAGLVFFVLIFLNESCSSLVADRILFSTESPHITSDTQMPFRAAGWQQQTLLEAAQLPGKLDQHIQFKGMCLWTRILPRVRKLYSPYKKHMSSYDDIRSVSAAFAQPVLQQLNKIGRCGLGSATDGEAEAQSSTSPALQLQGRSSTSLTSPNTFWNYPLSHLYRVTPKEPPAFDGDCEMLLRGGSAVLFSSIHFSLAEEK